MHQGSYQSLAFTFPDSYATFKFIQSLPQTRTSLPFTSTIVIRCFKENFLDSLKSSFLSLLITVVPYDGVICKGFIDYQVWLPDNVTIADVEGGLIASGINLAASLPDPCSSIFLSYACSSAYPRPVSTGQSKCTTIHFRDTATGKYSIIYALIGYED